MFISFLAAFALAFKLVMQKQDDAGGMEKRCRHVTTLHAGSFFSGKPVPALMRR